MKNIENISPNKITAELRSTWKRKIATIKEAHACKALILSSGDVFFMKRVDTLVAEGKNLSFEDSSRLSSIYNKVS